MSNEEISLASSWPSDHNLYVQTLIEIGFLDENYQLHDWSEHNPYAFYAPIRSVKAKISAHLKHGDEKSANALRKQYGLGAKRKRNASESQSKCPAPSPNPFPIPSPNPKTKKEEFFLPEWIDKVAWAAFEEMRIKIKKPMTDRARKNIISKLEAFKSKGHDNSITLSWQGVYEPGGNNAKRDNGRSFFERDVEQRKQAKQGARALLGVFGGGVGISPDADKAKIDGEGERAIPGTVELVPALETTRTG
jgi:hypothetical protein